MSSLGEGHQIPFLSFTRLVIGGHSTIQGYSLSQLDLLGSVPIQHRGSASFWCPSKKVVQLGQPGQGMAAIILRIGPVMMRCADGMCCSELETADGLPHVGGAAKAGVPGGLTRGPCDAQHPYAADAGWQRGDNEGRLLDVYRGWCLAG